MNQVTADLFHSVEVDRFGYVSGECEAGFDDFAVLADLVGVMGI